MSTKVTMNLTEEEIALITQLRSDLKTVTKTSAVVQSLRIAALVAGALKSGKQLAFLDSQGRPVSQVLIPGLSPNM